MKHPTTRVRVGLFAIAVLATMVMPAGAADLEDPIVLFTKTMPVFSHDRCTGCHGRVNPELASGNNHSVGQVTDTRDCIDCHIDAPGWKTRPDLTFFNRNARQLCQMQSQEIRAIRSNGATVAQAHAAYLQHLDADHLVGAAFIGTRAGATGQANPPGMSRGDFVTAAKAWLESGSGCGVWNGQVTQKETFGSNYTYPATAGGAGSTVNVNETAAREFKLGRAHGTTTVNVTASGSGRTVQTLRLAGLNGPCTSVATSDSSWTTTTRANAGGTLEIRIANDGSYTVYFRGPKEAGNGNTTGAERNDCGVQLPIGGLEPPAPFTWNAWAFTIRCPSADAICQLYDPDNKRLSGTMTRTVVDHMDAADPQSWLSTAPVGISRSDDGTSIPVTVTTTWDLTLSE